MEGNLTYESKQNSALNEEIAKLKSDIVAKGQASREREGEAEGRQGLQEDGGGLARRGEGAQGSARELDEALIVMAEEAELAREGAEAEIRKRSDDLRRMEESWRAAEARNVALQGELAELRSAPSGERRAEVRRRWRGRWRSATARQRGPGGRTRSCSASGRRGGPTPGGRTARSRG